MFGERKPKFRSRKLEFNKALEVYRYDDVDDFDEYDSPMRSVAQVATGVDKEEEDEHHLKQALTSQTMRTQTYYIPTPEAAEVISDYDDLYPPNFTMSKSYLKYTTGEDPLNAMPKYVLNEADKEFLKGLEIDLDSLLYERIIDILEESAFKLCENVVTAESLDGLRDRYTLPSEPVLNKIVDFWREQRQHHKLVYPRLRFEDVGKIGSDPYVCFRRRELKIPRKTRRSDAQIMDRLKKLYLDLSSMRLLLQAALKRDRYKREALMLEGELFEKYRVVDTWRKHHKSEWPPHLATFKTAAQSLLEAKKKKVRSSEEEDTLTADASYKIAIPVAALRGGRYGKPYYPHDVGRQIQRDLDTLYKSHHGQRHLDSHAQVAKEFCTLILDDDDYEDRFHPSPALDGRLVSYRKGRGGRIIIDRPHRPYNQTLNVSVSNSMDEVASQYMNRLVTAKDFTQLQTAVGNYNLHAVQSANQIIRPMSYAAWLAATAPILQKLAGGVGNKPKGSPKKKRPKTVVEGVGGVGGSSNPESPASSNGDITRLSASSNGQFTVKVKGAQVKETPRRGTGARFTPHGLAPEPMEGLTAAKSQ